MIFSVHLDLIGLPEGWLVVEEPEGNDSGNPGIKYRNYWTDDVIRLTKPPSTPAPLGCVHEYYKDSGKTDDAKKRKSISMHSIRQAEGSSDSINIAHKEVLSIQAAHLVPKASGNRCANCSVM